MFTICSSPQTGGKRLISLGSRSRKERERERDHQEEVKTRATDCYHERGGLKHDMSSAHKFQKATDPFMAKSTLSFVCQNCGAAYNRWQGKCESCGEWNTLAEEDTTGALDAGLGPLQAQGADVRAGNR